MIPGQGQRQGRAEILLVQDNEGDIVLALDVLESSSLQSRIHVARDGVDAMSFLRQEGPYRDAPRPDLVLLDLNLPRLHGFEVLEKVKSEPKLAGIPVVIFTSSDAEPDMRACYQGHANCYLTKPSDLSDYVATVRQLEQFWFETVRLPSN